MEGLLQGHMEGSLMAYEETTAVVHVEPLSTDV